MGFKEWTVFTDQMMVGRLDINAVFISKNLLKSVSTEIIVIVTHCCVV